MLSYSISSGCQHVPWFGLQTVRLPNEIAEQGPHIPTGSAYVYGILPSRSVTPTIQDLWPSKLYEYAASSWLHQPVKRLLLESVGPSNALSYDLGLATRLIVMKDVISILNERRSPDDSQATYSALSPPSNPLVYRGVRTVQSHQQSQVISSIQDGRRIGRTSSDAAVARR